MKTPGPSLSFTQLASDILTTYLRWTQRLKDDREGSKNDRKGSEAWINDQIEWGQGERKIMPRECSRCHSRLLDDAFAQYKRGETNVYIARLLPGGCGSADCDPVQVRCIPYDSKTFRYSEANKRRLVQQTRDDGWKRNLLRSSEACQSQNLPLSIITTCEKCMEAKVQGPVIEDTNPQ